MKDDDLFGGFKGSSTLFESCTANLPNHCPPVTSTSSSPPVMPGSPCSCLWVAHSATPLKRLMGSQVKDLWDWLEKM